MLWKKEVTAELVNMAGANTILEHLGIVITEIGDDYVKGTMPVDHRTHQPAGLLHGGASVVLAETLGSFAGSLTVEFPNETVVGVEINANHVRGVRSGIVTGVARPIHIGGRTQVWEIKINNEKEELVCISRLTLAVLRK
ncbi:MAG: hotdog fold thioesterase [Chitinophagales bacterium]|nr:hotdog fold thioesterase [Chitinophagales bacterium]